MSNARDIFFRLQQQLPQSYSRKYKNILQKAFDGGKFDEVIKLLSKDGYGKVAYGAVLQQMSRQHGTETKLRNIEAMFESMCQANIAPSKANFHSLMHAAARVGNCKRAEYWLGRMQEHNFKADTVSYGNLISAYSRAKDPYTAHKYLNLITQGMVQSEIHQSESTGKGYAAKGHTRADLQSYTSVISSYSKIGNPEMAAVLLDQAERNNLRPDVVTFSAVLDGFGQVGNSDGVVFWFNRMVSNNITPNVFSFAAVVQAFARKGDCESAQLWLDKARTDGVMPDLVMFNSLLFAHARAGNTAASVDVLKQMHDSGVTANLLSYSTILAGCATLGNALEAAKWFTYLTQTKGLQPDLACYRSMLTALQFSATSSID